jgi:hypothetical protein
MSMNDAYLAVRGRDFVRGGQRLVLRGIGLGSWLNLEHFMLGLPGSEGGLRRLLSELYGPERASQFWEAYRTALVDEADVRLLASLGVNAVRLPFNYRLFESDDAPGVFDPRGFEHLDRAVALCRKYGILAILDLHAAPGGQNPDWHSDNLRGESLFWEYADFRRRAVALWKHVAAHYRDEPWVGGYDLLNEPVVLHPDRAVVDRFFAECIREVRSVDPHHLMFVEGDTYARDFTMFAPFEDPNVACTFHLYPMFYEAELPPGPGRLGALDELLRRVVTFDDLQDRLGRPIWCGETGALRAPDPDGQLALLADYLEVLERRGISWSLWAYKDARAMGAVAPAADSPWMKLAARALAGWSLMDEFELGRRAAAERLGRLGVAAPEIVRLRLAHREMASQQTVLLERLRALLSGVPFEELLAATASFRLDRCEIWEGLTGLLQRFTRGP